jgi:RNA polymerase sigma factor for flagellar operon FliA
MLIAGEKKRDVAAALATLSSRSQLVLSLRFVEDLAVKEIAEVLGVSEPRVSQLVKAGLEQLRTALALHTGQEARNV